MKKYNLSLYIFRRDLRLVDNTALNYALNLSERVIPCFIFDPRQLKKHEYQNNNALQFMLESLKDLVGQIQKEKGTLYLFSGYPEKVLKGIFESLKIDSVFVNCDYTPFSIKRDIDIQNTCHNCGVAFHSYDDALLNAPENIHKDNGQPYKVFTAFMKKSRFIPVKKPLCYENVNYFKRKINGTVLLDKIQKEYLPESNSKIFCRGGRQKALKIMDQLPNYANYNQSRNYPAQQGTTGLSAHNKFGTVSIRELFHNVVNKLGEFHTLINELYWRDFFTHVAFNYPQVFGSCFHPKYENLIWDNDENFFELWCSGQTGYPIVDAGMHELNETGYMHNRVRMIVASFLTKHLHIDWRWGEKYFAQNLIDYDPCVNNGNWQWAASTGCDAQPYFRIFNPWLQQKKFDSEAVYIKKWIPKLADVESKSIHNWYNEKVRKQWRCDYNIPIVDHTVESKKAQKMFRGIKSQ